MYCSSERMMGFEPTTSTLARLRSTTELHPRVTYRLLWYPPESRKRADDGIRTHDINLGKVALYH